ncbi:MAG: tetratricopeptide repeat protein [Paludisphaera borealis]|uniref:tetratricopeptide repeat protein n=1 Tax=Paludisphaera borealis TaxID=1387353 RepID=UPI00283CFBB2|nr:tetratricopeptide repeat protein [Paludisphaera borealis]MDR3619295.1 tetratricopeptide repeat protein [Paludisphaera borealis]
MWPWTWYRILGTVLIAACLLAALGVLYSRQPAAPVWLIGDRVITRNDTALQVLGLTVDLGGRGKQPARAEDLSSIHVYKIQRIDGPWIWLVAENSGAHVRAQTSDLIHLDQAVEHITGLIRADPGDATKYNWRANILKARNELDEAIADYDEAVRLNPADASVYNNRGGVWYAKGNYDNAIADCTEAIRIDPGYASAHNNRGIAWCDKKEYDKALADFAEAIRIDPGKATYYNERGFAWRGKQEYDKAITDYDEAIRIDPGYAPAYNSRGGAWYIKKDYDKAVADYTEAVRLNPGDASVYNNRGMAWREKKEYDKAFADYDEAIRLDPGYTPAYNQRAWIWATAADADLRDGKRAVESATRAGEIDGWKDPNILDTLAAAQAEAGDFDAAVASQEKAIALIPADEAGRRNDFQTRLDLFRAGKPYHQ